MIVIEELLQLSRRRLTCPLQVLFFLIIGFVSWTEVSEVVGPQSVMMSTGIPPATTVTAFPPATAWSSIVIAGLVGTYTPPSVSEEVTGSTAPDPAQTCLLSTEWNETVTDASGSEIETHGFDYNEGG